ncbi:hypothetical protein [Actinomadura macra]|uniref:hypothetical protein n=1 Tax=Actinomadura macra TaxID=46164 RepID=UPI00082AE2D4|nr:hypothetical protein [Actinomadura macra]
MGNFFGELAKKLAERWVGLLAVPGLLFVACAWAGVQLGWGHALDTGLLAAKATKLGSALGGKPGPSRVLALVGLLLASCGVGLVVQALTGPVRACWLGRWPPGLGWARRRRTAARARRWDRLVTERRDLQDRYPRTTRTAEQQSAIDAAAERINRLSLAAPARPTWMGDRVAAVDRIALDRYGLDLRFGWSRLWLVLPDTVRAELVAANGQFAATVVTAAWALPYLALGVWWWPALLIALTVGLTGWTRARTAMAELTDLSEAALDLHGRTLALALGTVPPESFGPLTSPEGKQVTRHIRKGR